MASGLLLGLLVGGPGLFPTYFASGSARATCPPPTAFVRSALRLVKGYKLPPAAPEEKVTFTIWPKTSHVPEVVHRASGSGVRSSSFVDDAEIFAVKDAEMAIPGTLQADCGRPRTVVRGRSPGSAHHVGTRTYRPLDPRTDQR